MASSSAFFGGRVYAAVAADKSAEEVRRAIDECAPPGDERRRAEAVNEMGTNGIGWCKYVETPLQAAHRMRRGDLVGLLLEEGADASKVLGREYRPTTALALCVCYDLPDPLRALLRKGHDANQRLQKDPKDRLTYDRDFLPSTSDVGCTLAHLCVSPPRLSASDAPRPPPRLACLEALLREGGASVDARDEYGRTPLHCASYGGGDRVAVVDLLVRLGADVNARDEDGRTPIFESAHRGDIALLRRLLEHGASPDVISNDGYTPLMHICNDPYFREGPGLELARRSSRETRRAVLAHPGRYDDGFSAVDVIARAGNWLSPWKKELIAELLVSGAPVSPHHAVKVLPIAVSHGLPLAAKKEAELAALRPAELCTSWRAHEAFVRLALDVGELRAAEKEVEEKKRRVLELEMELLALGVGTESSSSESEEESDDDESESESESDDESESEEEEAGAAASGGGGQ